MTSLFDNGLKQGKAAAVDITALHAKIGQLTLRQESALDKAGAERKAMIGRDHKLSVSRQAGLLGISRGSV